MNQTLLAVATREFIETEMAPPLEIGSTVFSGWKAGKVLETKERHTQNNPTGITRDYLVAWEGGGEGWVNRCEVTLTERPAKKEHS